LHQITRLVAREVLDSRGNPTVEAEVHTSSGVQGQAIVPSGASTGTAEAHELRDAADARYDGRGVRAAVRNVRDVIGPALAGVETTDQAALDGRLLELDPTPQMQTLGAKAMRAVSRAAAHAGAAAKGVPLYRHLHDLVRQLDASAPECRMPLPMINMISGGLHAGGNLDFQDYLISPTGAASTSEALEWTVRIYRRLGQLLAEAGFEGRLVGDEGGFGPRLANNEQACEFVVRAIRAADLRPGNDVTIALDVASTHFFGDGRYRLSATGGAELSAGELIDYLAQLVDRYPITSIEDPLAEEDWDGWRQITARLGGRVRLVGDDLFATNASRLERGIALGAGNAILIKVNQIGTLSETLATIGRARAAGYAFIVSARSGETEDTTIADLAVATAADGIKIGSIVRSERLAKYNQLLRIAEQLERS
jgi:enolase